MKRILSVAAALVLAASLTACANTATDMAPGYDGDAYRGNVSTTDDGRVNGTNPDQRTTDRSRTDRTGRTATRPVRRPSAGNSNINTDAMGAGMKG